MENRNKMLSEEKINKLLLRLSLPATIGMTVNALYNVIDTIFIGWGVGPLAIGGLTIAFPIQMLIMAIAQMIGIGAASAISRSLGAGNKEKADYYAGNSYVLVVIIALVFSILGSIFIVPLLKLFGATPTLMPYAKDYLTIILLGSTFFSFAVSSNNLVRSEGNAKVAMVSMIIGTGLNIILDPILIFGFHMGIKGAALATIISQFMSFLYIVKYMYSGKSMLNIMPHHLKLKGEYVIEIITVGLPSFVRQVGGSFLAIILNHSLAFYGGDIAIATYGIINRLIMFLFMPMFGVVQGLQPIAGFNYGAKKYDRVNEVIKLSIKTLIVFASTGALLAFSFPKYAFMIFTDNAEVISIGSYAIRFIVFMLPIVGIQIISASIFQAFGKSKPSLFLSMLRQLIIFIPLVLILPKIGNLGLTGIWLSYPLSDFISTLISGLMLKKEMKNLNTIHEKSLETQKL
ncbi:MATE family efflux transporter [Helicovermis profundi]|uniref:Multidrug export protein MepA n=1 Tax=Helicovermis profundi TaxID=3065157 RepID=A0AAU9E6F0_9FIRM|nr:MATE family efflux transporter [Clostridia bacterium S502]